MSDKWDALRKALEAVFEDTIEDDEEYEDAANPSAIADLLAERDRLRDALQKIEKRAERASLIDPPSVANLTYVLGIVAHDARAALGEQHDHAN